MAPCRMLHWANVGSECWLGIGPMVSTWCKMTLANVRIMTVAPCRMLHWANVGPMPACYLGVLVNLTAKLNIKGSFSLPVSRKVHVNLSSRHDNLTLNLTTSSENVYCT